ncbi:MAG TPA: DUF2840 domain-containing protein [Petrimonas sp.]|nr:DUF2840 domain-containing protein [Petrimonas sp.]
MEFLTKTKLLFEEKRRNVKLLFGVPVASEDLRFSEGYSRKNVYFKPDSLFALELWIANDHGTVIWMVYVLRAVWPGETANRVPQVEPGAQILLHARGKGRVRKVLLWLNHLQEEIEDLSGLSPEYFQSAHYSLKNGLEPYSPREPFGPVLEYLKDKAQ